MATFESVCFKPVTETAKQIIIVASGPSAEDLNPILLFEAAIAGVHIIAVNTSIAWVPAAHSWFTLDVSDRTRWMMTHQRPGVTYYAAVPDDYGKPNARIYQHRVAPEPNIHWLQRVEGSRALASRKDAIHTGNSAWGALGLAVHMDAKDVVLIGVDGFGGYAYVNGEPRGNLRHLPSLFASGARQLADRGVQVINGSSISALTCFPKMNPNEAVQCIMGIAKSGVKRPQEKQRLHSQIQNAKGSNSRQRRLRASRRCRSVEFIRT